MGLIFGPRHAGLDNWSAGPTDWLSQGSLMKHGLNLRRSKANATICLCCAFPFELAASHPGLSFDTRRMSRVRREIQASSRLWQSLEVEVTSWVIDTYCE